MSEQKEAEVQLTSRELLAMIAENAKRFEEKSLKNEEKSLKNEEQLMQQNARLEQQNLRMEENSVAIKRILEKAENHESETNAKFERVN